MGISLNMNQTNKHIDIRIRAIPHKSHRYCTVGDYFTDKRGVEQVRVSEMEDWRYEYLVAMHELIEDFLCQHRGIKEEDITAFDVLYELERERGLHKDDEEPGFDKRAPYRKEHEFATKMEMLLAHELKVNWKEYDSIVMNL
jgi:hypothetical protein